MVRHFRGKGWEKRGLQLKSPLLKTGGMVVILTTEEIPALGVFVNSR